jgi:hypothetical protein
MFYKTPYIERHTGPVRWVHTLDLMGVAGVAIEGGTDRVRFDLSVAMVIQRNLVDQSYPSTSQSKPGTGPASRDPSPVEFKIDWCSEAGVTLLLSESDSLRIGGFGPEYAPILPSLKYRHSWEKMVLGAHIGFTQIVPSLGVSGGVQW